VTGFTARWIALVALGEAAGFAVAAAVGAGLAASAAPPAVALPVAVAAGAVEGTAYAGGQYLAMRSQRPPRGPWLLAGGLGAAVAWLLGMLPSTIGVDPENPGTWVAVGLGALLLLAAIPVAQWIVLRRNGRRAASWIPVSMGAWAVAVLWTAAPSPLIDESSPLALVVALYVVAGVLMALTVAALTAPLARRLFGGQAASTTASLTPRRSSGTAGR
jgi:hypothetical protein